MTERIIALPERTCEVVSYRITHTRPHVTDDNVRGDEGGTAAWVSILSMNDLRVTIVGETHAVDSVQQAADLSNMADPEDDSVVVHIR